MGAVGRAYEFADLSTVYGNAHLFLDCPFSVDHSSLRKFIYARRSVIMEQSMLSFFWYQMLADYKEDSDRFLTLKPS